MRHLNGAFKVIAALSTLETVRVYDSGQQFVQHGLPSRRLLQQCHRSEIQRAVSSRSSATSLAVIFDGALPNRPVT
jgi:hypothetical protein